MGDRANIAVYDTFGGEDATPVVFYTHWDGYRLPIRVRAALNRRQRWDDGAYLARIIFDAMTEGDHGSETGYGITSNSLCDNQYPVLVVDSASQRVAIRGEGSWQGRVAPNEGLSMEEFVAMSDDAAMKWARPE